MVDFAFIIKFLFIVLIIDRFIVCWFDIEKIYSYSSLNPYWNISNAGKWQWGKT